MLAELQQIFQDYVVDSRSNNISSTIHANSQSIKEQRINIYQHSYKTRLINVLYEDFPKLHFILGDEMFHQMASGYLKYFPSSFTSIRYFGDKLETYLKQTSPFCEQPILAEIADFEWGLNCALDSHDANILTIEDLNSIKPEDLPYLSLNFHPSLQLKTFYWQAPSIWSHIDDNTFQNQSPPKKTEAVHWLIWRQGLKVNFNSYPNADFALLKSIYEGEVIANACEVLVEIVPIEQIPSQVASCLNYWFNEGLIINDYKIS